MNIQYIFIIGIFFNFLMVGIFPDQLLGEELKQELIGDDYDVGYNFDNNQLFGNKFQSNIEDYYNTNTDGSSLEQIYDAEDAVTLNPLESLGGFFDGLLDALQKARAYLSFIVPFVTLFYLLPGILGLLLGSVYTGIFALAVIRFIRGV